MILQSGLNAPPGVSSQSLDSTGQPLSAMSTMPSGAATTQPMGSSGDPELDALTSDTQAALYGGTNTAALQGSEVQQQPLAEATNALGISRENDFSAVDQQRSIEQDKEFIAENRARYEQVQPTALPPRTTTGPNIAAYALQTTNAVGQPLYNRTNILSQTRYNRSCSKYPSPDLAQADFLSKGGPQRDRMGVDPDGDGFACSWDPSPFRKAAAG